MKKALIALAVASVVAPVAQADNVVIYGRLNTAYEAVQTKPVVGEKISDSTLSNQGSRFGLKGEEKIGDLTAEFQIENGFDSSGAAGGALATRDTFVGVKGENFGSVRLGRNETPTWKLFDTTVSKFHHAGLADVTAGSSSISRVGDLGARFSKSVIYTSTDMNGFKAAVQFADSQGATGVGATANTKPTDFSLNYAAGPITAGFAMRTSTTISPIGSHDRDNIIVLAGKYKVDQFDISAAWENDKYKSAGDMKRNVFYVSGQYNVAPNAALIASGTFAGKQKLAGTSQDNTGAVQITLGGQYDLSKRTQLYGYYTNLNNKDKEAQFALTGVGAAGTDQQAVVLGLRHNF